MSVKCGASGQKFNPAALKKIRWIKNHYPNIRIILDGGINAGNIAEAKNAGANTFVVGNYIYNAADRKEAVEQLRRVSRF